MAGKAACYLRSSKDRSDISPASQRHELEKLAISRSLEIVQIFEDAVESGATEDRPAFSALTAAIKNPARGWSHLLVYDTSRIARRRYIAQAIKHEAKKRGVTIHYANVPADLDPISELLLEAVFEAMDEAHSLMSRQKGLAGMAENVRRGWRAGGRAPLGYTLARTPTGAIRDGKPVTKSKLITNTDAPAIGAYLKARARGKPRQAAARAAGLAVQATSLIGIEWNALTYAGHTVWNRHAAEGAGTKRRAREHWQITRDTHPALISEAEAESILARLETGSRSASVSAAMASRSSFLLSGMLFTEDGRLWVGHGRYYRIKKTGDSPGKTVRADDLEEAILGQVRECLTSDVFLSGLLRATRKRAVSTDPAADIVTRIKQLEREKARAAEHALRADAAETFLTLVAERTKQIEALKREADAARRDRAVEKQLSELTVPALRALVANEPPERQLQAFVQRVILTPDLKCRIDFAASPGNREQWPGLASPTGFDTWPPELTVMVHLAA